MFKLIRRQKGRTQTLPLLVDERFNHGLPANLSGAASERAPINHGLKALQISVSAWTAEALKLTMPASVFSSDLAMHKNRIVVPLLLSKPGSGRSGPDVNP